MALSLRPEHLKRYKDVAALLVKHGRGDLATFMAAADLELADEGPAGAATDGGPEQLARDLEALGPTFIKLGPAPLDPLRPPAARPTSKRSPACRTASSRSPSPRSRRSSRSELGVPHVEGLRRVRRRCRCAAASLGQVHRARLRDGREVAVKVQRPGIRKVILEDLEAFAEIAGFLDKHTDVGRRYAFQDMLEEFRKTPAARARLPARGRSTW